MNLSLNRDTTCTAQARRTGTEIVNGIETRAVWAVWYGNEWGSVWTAEVRISLDAGEHAAIRAVRFE